MRRREAVELFRVLCHRSATIGACLRHHYEIPTGQRLLHAKGFPRQAFEFVSVNRSFRRSARDRQAEAGILAGIWPTENREEAIARTSGVREDAPELFRSMEALLGREP